MASIFPSTLNDIPLNADDSSRNVCWVVGLLVFLLGMIYTGGMMVSSPHQWSFDGNGRITVEIPLEDIQNPENLVQNVLSTLQQIPGVNQITLVDNQEILKTLQPWVGQVELLENISLPCLVDVDFKTGVMVNYDDILNHLQTLSSSITLEKHSQWQEKLNALRVSLEVTAFLFMILIAITVMVTITLVTRSSLNTHTPVIDALRLMGATNSYIARKFQNRAFWLAFRGGVGGAIAVLPTYFIINWLGVRLSGAENLNFVPAISFFAGIIIMPFIVAGFSLASARLCVMKTLRRMG